MCKPTGRLIRAGAHAQSNCLIIHTLKKRATYRHIVLSLCMAIAVMLSGCSEKQDPLLAQIQEIAATQELQSEEGAALLTDIILSDKSHYASYLRPDGKIDLTKLQALIEREGKRLNPDFAWDITKFGSAITSDLKLTLMLERSGSMTGYDSRNTSGDFKRTLNEMINRFPASAGAEGSIMIVNDDLYPWQGSFQQFVQEKDIFSATADKGNPAFTDFAKIFDHALCDTVAENINVLVTDMIYSPKDTEGVSAKKIFNEEQSLANSLFTAHSDKSVIIVKLSADFAGTYYPYTSPNQGFTYRGQRPYYLIISGSAAAMHKLRNDSRYDSFLDFESLPGYQAHYFFNRNKLLLPYFSTMPRDKNGAGNYSLLVGDSAGGSGAHGLKEISADASGSIIFSVAADLSVIPTTAPYLSDISNYEVSSDGVAQLLNVEAITPQTIDSRNKRYLSKATHLFRFKIDGKHIGSYITVSLRNKLPEWVEQSSATDDTHPYKGFATTTFGLKPLMEGIYHAYYGTATVPEFCSFTIYLEQ